mgnify:CR=1 FL=1
MSQGDLHNKNLLNHLQIVLPERVIAPNHQHFDLAPMCPYLKTNQDTQNKSGQNKSGHPKFRQYNLK